jgi:RNA polymerase-binding transcription factor DksA
MDSQLLEQIRQKLLEEQKRLERELASISRKEGEGPDGIQSAFPQFGSDEGENAAEVADYESRMSIERTLEGALADVASSLSRIDDGTYGLCKYCKEPIEEQRLLARPTSSSCINCKKKLTGE